METCSIEGCEKPVHVKAKGWCTTHYSRWHKHGDPLAWKRKPRSACSVEGCSVKVTAFGLCDKHYRRQRRYGTTEAPQRPTVCAVEECGRVVASHALCDMHYRRGRSGRDTTRYCRFCGAGLDPNAHAARLFCSHECKEREAYLLRRAEHRMRWLKKYGLTVAEYDSMLDAQGGVCAICRSTDPKGRAGSPYFVVDHCHKTGAVRGLLCAPCNSGLGSLQDDPELLQAAAAYLRR